MLNDDALPILNVGDRVRIVCPACGGGNTGERSMLVSRDHIRTSWHCFRANCGEGGGRLNPSIIADYVPAEKPVRPYLGATYTLDDETWQRVWDTYNVDASSWRMTDSGRLLLPICGPTGVIRGHVLRRPWWDPVFEGPKTITYWNMAGPLLAWYIPSRPGGTVLIVEDQLSAQRASTVLAMTTVALIGTEVNAEKIGEIQSVSRDVVIALDTDATGQAFAIARKWGQAFKSCRVQVLPCDIKDMPMADLTKLTI